MTAARVPPDNNHIGFTVRDYRGTDDMTSEEREDRSPDAGRYDAGSCQLPAPSEQREARGIVPSDDNHGRDRHRGVRGVAPPGDNCITCGDVAVEVRVARLLPDALAVVDTGKGEEQVSVALVAVTVGDRILVHAGEAIAVVGR
jgi:hydrogenase expression/formation protein HypC